MKRTVNLIIALVSLAIIAGVASAQSVSIAPQADTGTRLRLTEKSASGNTTTYATTVKWSTTEPLIVTPTSALTYGREARVTAPPGATGCAEVVATLPAAGSRRELRDSVYLCAEQVTRTTIVARTRPVVTPPTTPTPPARIVVSPDTVRLTALAGQLPSLVSVTFSATNGAVCTVTREPTAPFFTPGAGLNIAVGTPQPAGVYRDSAVIACAGLGSVTVPVIFTSTAQTQPTQPPQPSQPTTPTVPPTAGCVGTIICETFSYANTAEWRTNPRGWWKTGTLTAAGGYTDGTISADPGEPGSVDPWRAIVDDPTAPSGRALEYTYPDRTSLGGSGNQGRCANWGIASWMMLPTNGNHLVGAHEELYVEAVVKFSSNFTTRPPDAWGCNQGAYFKFFRTQTFIRNTGNFGYFALQPLQDGEPGKWGVELPGNDLGSGRHAASPADGQWHTIRWRMRTGSNGLLELKIDGRPVTYGSTSTASVTRDLSAYNPTIALILSTTMNSGVDRTQTVRWGSVKVWAQRPAGWQ